MDSAQYSCKSVLSTEDPGSNILKKLRRLKIEEDVLSKSIVKTSEVFVEDVGDREESVNYLQSKLIHNKLRTSYIEIRDLFEEIRDNTISQDIIAVDIEDVKNTIMSIESKINDFKSNLEIQIKSLKLSEEQLMRKMNEIPVNIEKLNKRLKIPPTPLKEIVPSPVKTIINSPMKCPDIQQFQEFLASSKNRYGGWIPYSHSIFEKSWHKFFCIQKNIEDFEYEETNVENSRLFGLFVNEVCEKLPGISIEKVIAHNKWYTKYIFLKERKQRALEKWKTNRQLMKKPSSLKSNEMLEPESNEKFYRTKGENVNEIIRKSLVSNEFAELKKIMSKELKCDSWFELKGKNSSRDTLTHNGVPKEPIEQKLSISEKINKALSNRPPLAYQKTTEQWNNRCIKDEDSCKMFMDVENVFKRHIPEWRLVLRNQHQLK